MKDLTGQKFNRWTVLSISEKRYRSMTIWLCRCECGVEREIIGNNITRNISKSCGCLKLERTKACKTIHGDAVDGKLSSLYRIWQGMKERCFYPSQPAYKYYGGRGIKLCQEWHAYYNFKRWAIENGYREGLSIERINNDGNYEPENCRWISKKLQARNTRKNTIIEIGGVKKCLIEWCHDYEISRPTVSSRISRGWNPEKAITTPVIKGD